MNNKTHWLQNPNKNYLGHWDLPNGDPMVLTIKSAKWEEVKNPVTGKSDAKRVVRFIEKVKPLICNQVNAQSILKSTGNKFMEDSEGCKITVYIGTHYDTTAKENIDCLRVKMEAPIINKPKLSPDHKRWDEAKNAVQTGEADYDSLCEHWQISLDDFQLLCG